MQEKKEKLLEDKEVSKDIEQNIAWWKQLFSDCADIKMREMYLVKMGGPMMGFPLNTLEVPMMKGSNGIIAVEPDETKEQPCIKCGRCVDVLSFFFRTFVALYFGSI